MTQTKLLLAAAAVVLAASPLVARPMTARDMQSMHRLGAPEVSPDGRWAVFTLSDTDFAKNKRSQHAAHPRPDRAWRQAAAAQGG